MSDNEELKYKISADASDALSKLEKTARALKDAGAGTDRAGDLGQEAGNQAEEAGNQAEEAGNQAEEAGNQAEQAGQKAAGGVRGLGEMVKGLTTSVKGLLQVSAALNVWTALFRLLEKTVGWVRDKIEAWNEEQERMAEEAIEHAHRIAEAAQKIRDTEFKKATDSLRAYADELDRTAKLARDAEDASLALARAEAERDNAKTDLAVARGEKTEEEGAAEKRARAREVDLEQLDAGDKELRRQAAANQATLDKASADLASAREDEKTALDDLTAAYGRLNDARKEKTRLEEEMSSSLSPADYIKPRAEAKKRIAAAEKEIGDATQEDSLAGRYQKAKARREAAEENLKTVEGPAKEAVANAQTRLQANAAARETIRISFDAREAAAAKRKEKAEEEERQKYVDANNRFNDAVRAREVAEAPTQLAKLETRLSHEKTDLVSTAFIPDEVEAATARERISARILELERQIGEERARQAREGEREAKAEVAEAEKRVKAIGSAVSRGEKLDVADAASRRGLYGGREGRAVAAPQMSGYQSAVKSQLAKIAAAAEKIKQNTRQQPGGEVTL